MAKRLTSTKLKSIQGEQYSAEEQLDGYDDTYLECRDLRHSWKIQGFFNYGGEVVRRLSCSRCKTVREDHWEPNGERISGRYKYPDGYSIRGSNVKAFDVRREVLHRVKVYANEEQMQQALFTSRQRKSG